MIKYISSKFGVWWIFIYTFVAKIVLFIKVWLKNYKSWSKHLSQDRSEKLPGPKISDPRDMQKRKEIFGKVNVEIELFS